MAAMNEFLRHLDTPEMQALYRDLAPINDAAWEQIEEEATRTFKRNIAGRRVVDVSEHVPARTVAVGTSDEIGGYPADRGSDNPSIVDSPTSMTLRRS